MRRGQIRKPRRRIFPLRIIIPLVFLVLGVAVAFSFVTGPRTPEPRPEPVIIMPGSNDPFPIEGGYDTTGEGQAEPIPGEVQIINPDLFAGPVADEGQDQFTSDRIASYSVPQNQPELRRSVDQFAGSRANQCAGEIAVRLNEGSLNVRSGPAVNSSRLGGVDRSLNVRSGPAVNSSRLGGVDRDTRHNVLLWAPDPGNAQLRWFLLVDEGTRTVRGWVRSDYCDTANVIYAN